MSRTGERPLDTECVAMSVAEKGDLVNAQFGRARRFLLFHRGPNDSCEALENPNADASHGAGPATASLLIRHGVTTVLAGRFGPKALQVLRSAGVSAFTVPAGTRGAEALERLQTGSLERAG